MKLEGRTTPELVEMQAAIERDPQNQTSGGLWKYTPAARKKLDAIQRQITHNLAMKRAAEGRPVECDGYSGRQTNRR